MNAENRRTVELLALQLAGLVVAIHLSWGLSRLAGQLRHGVYIDPRPGTFVLSAAAIIAGVAYVALGGRRRPVYLLGIALMLTYMLGYWAWHLIGHVPAMPWVETQTDPHPEWGPVETLVRHLAADPIALVSKLVEGALAIVLGVLYVEEGRRDSAAASDGEGSGDDSTAPPTERVTPESTTEPVDSSIEQADSPTEPADSASEPADSPPGPVDSSSEADPP